MIEDRLDKLIEHLEELHSDTCPRLDANAKQSDLPFCNEEFCMNNGGGKCWKMWIMGETE